MRPVMLLIKAPVPDPSTVLVGSATVGPVDVLQQTPLAVTDAPPSAVILPPDVAVAVIILVTGSVVNVGATGATATHLRIALATICVPYPFIAAWV